MNFIFNKDNIFKVLYDEVVYFIKKELIYLKYNIFIILPKN